MGSQVEVCAACGGPLGVYEPLTVVDSQGRVFTTSLLRENEAAGRGGLGRELFHAECFERVPDADAA